MKEGFLLTMAVLMASFCFLVSSCSTSKQLPVGSEIKMLPMAHSHNDYEQKVPLYDALSYGFGRIEPDVYILSETEIKSPGAEPVNKDFAKDSTIMVGHNFKEYKGSLYDLYIKGLKQYLGQGKYVFNSCNKPIIFMIDMKTNGSGSIKFMNEYLSKFSDIFNDYNDKVQDKPVTVILSGYNGNDVSQQDIDYLLKTPRRYVGLDGRIDKPLLGQDKYPQLYPLISNAWDNRSEETFMKNIREAHAKGQTIRFWGIDDNKSTWDKLYTSGVDVISTDDLKGLRDYLLPKIQQQETAGK